MGTNADNDYLKYRGKCKEFSEAACAADPSLVLVRGHYYCPVWDRNEQHWWCQRRDGSIYDPTKDQFPSKGLGTYTVFSGWVECDQCGKSVKEEDARFESNYSFCSEICLMRFVGL